jgi:hypothetical protein
MQSGGVPGSGPSASTRLISVPKGIPDKALLALKWLRSGPMLLVRGTIGRRAGNSNMKRFCTTTAVVVLATIYVSQVQAAPPTVTPSPGYDARLQEQRAASRLVVPIDPVIRPVYRRHHVRRPHYDR